MPSLVKYKDEKFKRQMIQNSVRRIFDNPDYEITDEAWNKLKEDSKKRILSDAEIDALNQGLED